MLKKKYIPLSVIWETTLKCNMNCKHCGSSAGTSRKNELTTKEGIQLCNDLDKLGTRLITLMGGEPFLRKDWNILAQHIRDLGINITIISNGLLIDKKIVKQLKMLNPYTVAISLDGGTVKTHNAIRGIKISFDRCMNSLNLLTKENIPTTVITTVHKQNYTELPIIRDLLLNRGIAWQIQMATLTGRFPTNLMLSKGEFYSVALFIASTRKKYSIKELPVIGAHNFGYYSKLLPNVMLLPWLGCQAGITTLGIQSDGFIKGCMSLPDRYIEGNIREKNIRKIWNDPDSFSYNRNFNKNKLSGECMNCSHWRKCKGGCLTVSSTLTGKNHCNPYCMNLIEKKMLAE